MTTVADNESNLEVRLGGVEGRLGNVETQLVDLTRRTGNVETQVANLTERMSNVEGRLIEMSASILDMRITMRYLVIAIIALCGVVLTCMAAVVAALVAILLKLL